MKTHNHKLARRLARMAFALEWGRGAANTAHAWTLAPGGEANPEFRVCFNHALDGARSAVKAGEAVERILHSKRKADATATPGSEDVS